MISKILQKDESGSEFHLGEVESSDTLSEEEIPLFDVGGAGKIHF